MENRERDKMSRNTGSTSAGDVNRNTSAQAGKENDTSAEFGQKIGRSEKLNDPTSRGSDSGTTSYEESSDKSSGSMGSNSSKNNKSGGKNDSTSGSSH